MSAEFDRVLARLECVRGHGSTRTARCPAHADRNPSLSVRLCDDGRVLLHCFAGCEPAGIVRALGLEMRDLFVRRSSRSVWRWS